MRKFLLALCLVAVSGCQPQQQPQTLPDILPTESTEVLVTTGQPTSTATELALIPALTAETGMTIVTNQSGISVVDWVVTVQNNSPYTAKLLVVDFLDSVGSIVTETDQACIMLPTEKRTFKGRLDMANEAIMKTVRVSAYLVFERK